MQITICTLFLLAVWVARVSAMGNGDGQARKASGILPVKRNFSAAVDPEEDSDAVRPPPPSGNQFRPIFPVSGESNEAEDNESFRPPPAHRPQNLHRPPHKFPIFNSNSTGDSNKVGHPRPPGNQFRPVFPVLGVSNETEGQADPTLTADPQADQSGMASPPPPPPPPPTQPTPDQDMGGHMGDRCPDSLKDDNGDFPDFCYDVIDENGACIMDDMILLKDDCINWLGQDFYDKQLELQRQLNANRTAANDAVSTNATTGAPDMPSTTATAQAQIPATATQGAQAQATKSDEASEAMLAEGRREAKPSGPEVRRDNEGPTFNSGVLEAIGYQQNVDVVQPTLEGYQPPKLAGRDADGP